MKGKSIILVLGLLLIAGGIYLLIQSQQSQQQNGTLCTQDVFECEDGSFVSRNPDNGCEFNDCPVVDGGSAGGTFPEGTAPQTHEVNLQNFAFSPSELTIQVGDTVVWTNLDSTTHTVTSDSGSEINSGNLANSETYSHTFNTVGNFAYHCNPHPGMKGTISVE